MSNTIIYHNPDCGTSRNTLAMIRNSGMEPTIIYYLDTPPSREELVGLRKNVEPYAQLGLDDETLSDERLIESMLQHPILINRPIVVTPLGTRLCRPSEVVLEILTQAQEQPFRKEDGEWVAAASDQRLP
jgi:arsenate reductase